MTKLAIILVMMLTFGCNGSDDDDSSTETGTTDTDTETDTVDSDTWENVGMCGAIGTAIATTDAYSGTEDIYLVADKGEGEDVCRIRMDLTSVGAPEVPCDICEWEFVLEKSNVQVIADVDDACGTGSLGLDADAIAALEGEQVSIGYTTDYLGHVIGLMQYDEEDAEWKILGWVTYDDDTGDLSYEFTDGLCGY